MVIFKRLSIFLFISLSIFPFPAFSQNPPPGQDVAAQSERLKTEAERQEKQLEGKKIKPPQVEIQQEEKKEEKPALEAISFVLKDIKITGVTVFKPQDFRPIYEPYLNKKVTFKDIENIVEKIKAKYKEKGYLTTTAFIPEQEIKEGRIEIRVMEGKMGNLNIEGNKWFSTSLIEKFFHLKKNEILDVRKLQRDLLRLNKIPDLQVKAIISQGEKPQISDITLKAIDKFPWHTGFAEDNKGTRLSGKQRYSTYLRSTNATGRADSFFITTLYSGRSFGESISYTTPIDNYGTKFGLDLTFFKMKIGREFKSLVITGNTQIYTPRIQKELYLSENFEAYADLGMDIKCVKKKAEGNITSNDQLRLPYFSFDFTKIDAFAGQTSFSPKFTFGTKNFWGASSRNHPTSSRAGTGGTFFKYGQDFSRIQRMPGNSYLSIHSQFQAASHTLPSSEQLQLGGANSIRGYPEGDYLADMGGNLNLEWSFSLRPQIEPLFFVDLGGGKLKKVLPGEKKNKFLAGLGAGLRIRLFNKVFLQLEGAKHIGDEPTSGSGPSTFHLTFQTEM